MATTTAQRTFGQTVVELARQRGLIRGEGTATAGTATTLTDATNYRLAVANANQVIGKYLYIYGGTSAGTLREITSYGTIGVFTWTGNATVPDTTSTWILLDRNPKYLIDAIRWAQEVLGFETCVPYDCTSLAGNNYLMHYGDFEEWANGASAAADGWVSAGSGAPAFSREATIVGHGDYSHKIVADAAAVATITRTFPFSLLRNLDGATVKILGLMAEVSGGDGRVRLAATNSAGTASNTDFAGTYISSRWEELYSISSADITLPSLLTNLTLEVRAGANGTVYADDLMLIGPTLRDYDLPASLVAMHPVILLEDSPRTGASAGTRDVERFSRPLYYKRDWYLRRHNSTTARQVSFHDPLPDACHLLISGRRIPGVVTAAATNLNIDAEVVATVAAGHLNDATPAQVQEARMARRRASTIVNSEPLIWIDESLAST